MACKNRQIAAIGLFGLAACAQGGHTTPTQPVEPSPNFLVVMSDDQGVDWVGAFNEEFIERPLTPRTDEFASEGLLFRRAYTAPSCSPARAALLSGRFGFRHGIGTAIYPDNAAQIADNEVLIPAVLDRANPSYYSALLGKWHLGLEHVAGLDHPLRHGFDEYAGSFGGLHDYAEWERVENGREVTVSEYPTIVTTDAAIDALGRLPEPWFLMVSYNAPHAPFHQPPSDLHSYDLDDDSTDRALFAATIQALDTEFGRLLDAMSAEQRANTYVIYLGDNGTMNSVMQPRESYGGKNSVRETGTRTPLMIRGPDVPAGAETQALVQTADFLPTLAELARTAPLPDVALDGTSFADVLTEPTRSGREWIYAERFFPNGDGPWEKHRQSARNDRFKLIRTHDEGTEDLYDLQGVTREADPIRPPYTGAAEVAWAELSALLDQLSN